MKNVNNGSIRVIGGRRYRLNLDDSSFQSVESSDSRCATCSRYISTSEAFGSPACRFCSSASPSMSALDNNIRINLIPSPQQPGQLPTTHAATTPQTASDIKPETYTDPFCKFITENPTVFHAVDAFAKRLAENGFVELSEREDWTEKVKAGGKYYTKRNGSSMMAFVVGQHYTAGNGMAMLAGHIDALTARLKPISKKSNTEGYIQLGVAPYAGGLNMTWWDRDLSIGGRVMVKEPGSNKTVSKLVKLGWPIAKIPTLAPHFGTPANGPFNKETQMVPIIGLEGAPKRFTNNQAMINHETDHILEPALGSFTSTQPPRLVELIAKELGLKDTNSIVDWELELFDSQPATVFGLDLELLSACRIDDKICSWAAMEGLVYSADAVIKGGTVALAGFFDDEEIGSKLRQGAAGNYMPMTVERIVECFGNAGKNTMGRTYANSFLVSADVIHAVNPNFANVYLEHHKPHLNIGIAIEADPNGHMTTDAVSSAILKSVAEKSDSKLQIFQIRNDSRSGGTVGPMLSSMMGVRGLDAGIAQLSMHSIRATVGSLDPGLGVKIFAGYFEHYETVDEEFSST